MKGMARIMVAAVAAAALIPTGATAHPRDVVTTKRAGRIVRNRTTMPKLRKWFGAPTKRRVREVGCSEVIDARFGPGLRVYAWRDDAKKVAAIFATGRTVSSDELGALRFHTRKGLRVGDRGRKVRRLYPGADRIAHAGHVHYRLRDQEEGGRLHAKVVDRRVVRLEVWPFEFC